MERLLVQVQSGLFWVLGATVLALPLGLVAPRRSVVEGYCRWLVLAIFPVTFVLIVVTSLKNFLYVHPRAVRGGATRRVEVWGEMLAVLLVLAIVGALALFSVRAFVERFGD